jgi:hypothetical protein
MVSPLIEASAPGWAVRYALRVDQAFKNLFPKAPDRLWGVLQADLPDAAKWTGCTVYVSDLQKVGLSNGTTWTQTDGGAL